MREAHMYAYDCKFLIFALVINAAAEATYYLQTQQANALATANLIGM